jgi:hypothetical protein
MPDDTLTLDEIRRMAAEIGMTRLTDQHLQELLRATRIARVRRAALPIGNLAPADEPAHVFRPEDDRALTPSPSPGRSGEMDGGK